MTSYGGFLRYTLRHVPSPGSQTRNNAADVQLISVSCIRCSCSLIYLNNIMGYYNNSDFHLAQYFMTKIN